MVTPAPVLTVTGFLFDTSILIGAEKGIFDVAGFIRKYPKFSYAISAVTASELLTGVENANSAVRKRHRSDFVERVFMEFPVLDFSLPCARRCAYLTSTLQKSGIVLGSSDLQIGATALLHGFGVVTFNAKDFLRIPNLVVKVPVIE